VLYCLALTPEFTLARAGGGGYLIATTCGGEAVLEIIEFQVVVLVVVSVVLFAVPKIFSSSLVNKPLFWQASRHKMAFKIRENFWRFSRKEKMSLGIVVKTRRAFLFQ